MSMKCDPVMWRELPVTFVMIEVTSTALTLTLMKMSQRSRSRENDQRSYLEACSDNPMDMALHNVDSPRSFALSQTSRPLSPNQSAREEVDGYFVSRRGTRSTVVASFLSPRHASVTSVYHLAVIALPSIARASLTVFQAIPSIRAIAEMLTPSTLSATTASNVARRCWRL